MVQYIYDAAGHLENVTSLAGTGAYETFYNAKMFDEFERPLVVEYGNGVVFNYEYYENSVRLKRLYSFKGTTDLQDLTYTYDKVSNVKSIADAIHTSGNASSSLSNIQYDDLHRLVSLNSVASGSISYAYDVIGNIITNGEHGAGIYQYNGSGHAHAQPHAATAGAGKAYGYDPCGNMITRGTQSLVYDELNRLIQVSQTGQPTVTFGYAGQDTRIWKKSNGILTNIWVSNLYEVKYSNALAREVHLCHVIVNGKIIASFEPEGQIAGIIENSPFLAGSRDIIFGVSSTLFGDGRTPITLMAGSVLFGLCSGLWIRRGKQIDLYYFGSTRYRVVCMVMFASLVVFCMPEIAYAGGGPAYSPVFYYYGLLPDFESKFDERIADRSSLNRTDFERLSDNGKAIKWN